MRKGSLPWFGAAAIAAFAAAWLATAGPGPRRPVRALPLASIPPAAATRAASSPDDAAIASPRAEPHTPAGAPPSRAAVLAGALLDADREAHGPEVLEARRLLERALRADPMLAAALAGALGRLSNRELAFQVGRILAAHLGDPRVRAALLDLARGGDPVPREAALTAFTGLRGDPEAARAVASAFADREAPGAVRAAAACALIDLFPALSEKERAAARETARDLVLRKEESEEARAAALDLLDVRGDSADRERARAALERPGGVRVALAAARVLLAAGEPAESVLAALSRAAETAEPPLCDALRAAIEAHR